MKYLILHITSQKDLYLVSLQYMYMHTCIGLFYKYCMGLHDINGLI